MPQYKLTYFNLRGLGEPARLIFAFANVPYEDVRIPHGILSPEQKEELRLPWGQLPILEVDGKIIAQSMTIARFLARRYKLTGIDDFEDAKCDDMVAAFTDYTDKWSSVFRCSDEERPRLLKSIEEVDTPKMLSKLNNILQEKGSSWLVGSNVTWADIYISHYLTHFEHCFDVEIIKGYPAVAKMVEAVHNLPGIKEWVAKRPDTKW